MTIDRSAMDVDKDGGWFEPFRPDPQDSLPLSDLGLDDNLELIVFERSGLHRGLLVRDMDYHHCCQGELAGKPYLVSYCGRCNTAVGLTPVVNGQVHWFRVCGMANRLSILCDEETHSLWDHITGEAFEGALVGQQLGHWAVQLTTVRAARVTNPELELVVSDAPMVSQWAKKQPAQSVINGAGFLPPNAHKTMSGKVDPRLPELEQGLGLIVGKQGKFYPMKRIPKRGSMEDTFAGRPVMITRGALDGVPSARWQDGSDPPMQLLTRWYGFSFTYPECQIYRTRLADRLFRGRK